MGVIKVKGHYRTLPSGKRVFVREHTITKTTKSGGGDEDTSRKGDLVEYNSWEDFRDDINKVGWENMTLTKLGRKWLGLDLKSDEAKDIYAEMKKEAEYAKNQWEKADSEQKLKDLRSKQAKQAKQAEQTNRTKTDDSDDTSSKTTKKETYGSDNPSSSATTGDSNKKSWYKSKSWSNNNSTSEKSRDTVVDVDWTDVSSSSTWKKGRDTVIDAEWTDISSSNTSTGRSYVSGLLNSPVAGLLEAPKD